MSHLYRRPAKSGIYWLSFYKHGKHYAKSLRTKDPSTAKYLQSKTDQDLHEDKYILYNANPLCLDVLKEYTEATKNYKAKKTNSDDDARIRAFIKYAGIDTVKKISEEKLQDYLNHRINEDQITLSSANRITSTIKAWINFAVRRNYLAQNPIKTLKKYRLPQNPPKYLTQKEVNKILSAAKGTRLYHPILTALYTGMRKRELFALEWSDIDFHKDTITVINKDGFTTKSKKFRVIPLHITLKVALLPLKQPQGRCFDATNYIHLFPRIVASGGLKNIGWHHFRHTFASHLYIKTRDIYLVSELLGHSSLSVTKIYTHLVQSHAKHSVNQLQY